MGTQYDESRNQVNAMKSRKLRCDFIARLLGFRSKVKARQACRYSFIRKGLKEQIVNTISLSLYKIDHAGKCLLTPSLLAKFP